MVTTLNEGRALETSRHDLAPVNRYNSSVVETAEDDRVIGVPLS